MREENFKAFVPRESPSATVAFDNEVLSIEVGSSLTGITSPDSQSDYDLMAIFIEPIEYVVGFKHMEHFTWRSKPSGVKSEAGDIDLTSYSLRKFMSLAMQGNPSIIQALFPPHSHIKTHRWPGIELLSHKDKIVSKKAGPRFLGYLDSQVKRLKGELQGHMPKRPDLIEKHGYDTKYAAHALRLAIQGVELMSTGRLEQPIPSLTGDFLRSVRRGAYSIGVVLEDLEAYREYLVDAIDRSELPEEPDYGALELWMTDVHQEWWRGTRR